MQYRIALLDVDDTLLDFGRAEKAALAEAFAAEGVPFDDGVATRYHEINDALWKRLEKGEIDRQGLWEERFTQLFRELSRPLPPGINSRYMESLGTQAFPVDGAREMLEQASRLARLFIVTNGVGPVQRQRLKKAGLDGFFEAAFISHELGVQKPSAAFFDKVFAAIGPVRREETVLLGDSLTSDMKGARAAGISACWYCPDREKTAAPGAYDFRIERLAQFIGVLKGEME